MMGSEQVNSTPVIETASSIDHATTPDTTQQTTDDITQIPSVTEGQATIYSYDKGEVFYNPVQEFNRDMSIAAIRNFIKIRNNDREEKWKRKEQAEKERKLKQKQKELHKKKLLDKVETQEKDKEEKKEGDVKVEQEVKEVEETIAEEPSKPMPATPPPTVLEALAASGLRSIRYAKEIPGIGHITTNDLDPHVVDEIRRNFANNGIKPEAATPNQGDACDVMYTHRNPLKQFDIVDLDPYGSASPFIDAAVQSVADRGLLCITCTDLAVLASTQHTESCYAKYGGIPLKAGFCHEAALRMVIQMVMASAARYKRAIKPLVSCSIDFYVRIFFQVHNSASLVKNNASSTSVVYRCSGCGTFELSPLGKLTQTPKGPKYGITQGPPIGPICRFCQNKLHMGGPMYNGKLHDQDFVRSMLELIRADPTKFNTFKRMEGMLTLISEELDTPLYYLPPDLCTIVRASTMNYMELRSAFLNSGFQISASHCAAGSFKTDAPPEAIWDIFRSWAKKGSLNLEKFSAGSPGLAILKTEPTLEVSFEFNPKAKLASRSIKLVRYQVNPTKNWGPKARHKRPAPESSDNQNGIKSVKTE